MKEITRKVISYCDIPEEVSETINIFDELSCGVYWPYNIINRSEREKYPENDWDLDDWILKNYPELEGQEILIDIDY